MDTNQDNGFETHGPEENTTVEDNGQKGYGFKERFNDYAAQTWPILMLILGGLSLLGLLVGVLIWKVIGVIGLVWAVRELRRCQAAKKAGVVYAPLKARFAYIALVIVALVIVVQIISSSFSPVAQVKGITFDACPGYTVGEIIAGTMENVNWSYESGDSLDWVYVRGVLGRGVGEEISFKFSVEEEGDYYYVSVEDMWYDGYWWGEVMAFSSFLELYYNM